MAIAFGASLGTPVSDTENSLTTIALTTGVTVPSGGFLVLGVSWYNAGVTASVAGGSLTWAKDAQKDGVTDTSRHLAAFSAQAPSGLASGSTLTATFSGGSFGRAIWGAYFTGVATSSPVDQTATNAGVASGTTWTPGSVTTTNADDLLVAVAWDDGRTTTETPTSPMVEAIDFNNALNATWTMVYRIVAATSSYNAGGVWAAAGGAGEEWTALQVAYKADTGAAVAAGPIRTFNPIPFMGGL